MCIHMSRGYGGPFSKTSESLAFPDANLSRSFLVEPALAMKSIMYSGALNSKKCLSSSWGGDLVTSKRLLLEVRNPIPSPPLLEYLKYSDIARLERCACSLLKMSLYVCCSSFGREPGVAPRKRMSKRCEIYQTPLSKMIVLDLSS